MCNLDINQEIEDKIKEMPELKHKKDLTRDDRIYAENNVLLAKAYEFLKKNNKIIQED